MHKKDCVCGKETGGRIRIKKITFHKIYLQVRKVMALDNPSLQLLDLL